MNFEKVELYGFKSFADKAEIKFGDGITCIVGPNGCGKSNVADAIRWVLGEQSAKTLRGSSMQDVIFAGTQGRKSLSYCEVSLFFDNSTKMFSIDYNEVIITRKLYRSGESEYFINKQPARLKDIVDLLHECGIGKEGYSIIGQGKVEEIMSAKPEDRRMIFEEATGIAKFKSRKLESERKLDRTHENIVRYADILSEIENQLGPLGKQAEKAKEFNELSEQLKHHEINTYIAKADGVGVAKAKINERIKGITEETELRRNELSEAQKEYERIFDEINSADSKLQSLNDELGDKRVGIERTSGAKQLYEERISFLESQIARGKETIKENDELIKNCEESLIKNKSSIEEKEVELKEAVKKSDALDGEIKTLNEKIIFGEELAQSNQKKIIESIESLSDIRTNKSALTVEKENINEKLNELTVKLDELSVKRNDAFNDKEKSDKTISDLDRSVFDFKNRITEKEDEVRNGNEAVAEVDNLIFKLNSDITATNTRYNFYKEMKESYEGYNPTIKLLMTRAKENGELRRRIKGVVAELIKCDKKFDIALETSLAAAAQNVVTDDTEDAKYLIEYLKTNKLGRLTFLPISSVKPRYKTDEVKMAERESGALGVANELVEYDAKFENVISNLLGNTLIVDTLENATRIANKYRFAFKMVTLDGDVFSTQGAMTGGSRRQESAGILSNDRKIETYENALKEKRSEMELLKQKKGKLEEKRDKALNELSVLNDAYNSGKEQLVVERQKQLEIEKTLSDVGREIESTSDIMDGAKERLLKLSADYESVDNGSKKLEEDRENAGKSADKHLAEYDALKKEKEKLSAISTEYQVKITELKGDIANIKTDNERLENTIIEAKASTERLLKSNEGALDIIEQHKLDIEKVTLTKEEQEEVDKLRERIAELENSKTELREKLTQNGDRKTRLEEELSELTEKKHEEEISLTKIDTDLEYMGQTLLEDYQLTYETAQEFKEEGYDAVKGEAEITRIRRKRSSLGEINATAIEGCKELKERYDEMMTQKEDLEKAESDLKEAIDKIKAEMLTQFDEGFNKINENFQKIFRELFGGGRAMLELDYTQVEDKLEAGIEIIAEPPGKKLQKLSLLSGGEKALTAIAILFSILRMRPMPFCILDEIEAALDEANVDRFARYLQKFSQETQFIVITHRKPTMEMADSLFGVTMQEKGVSKMVSVKLSEAAAFDAGQAM